MAFFPRIRHLGSMNKHQEPSTLKFSKTLATVTQRGFCQLEEHAVQ